MDGSGFAEPEHKAIPMPGSDVLNVTDARFTV
jgi:hypothetical protein